MSVINKMLRDLDKQQHQASRGSARSFYPQKRNYLLLWLLLPVALLVGWLGQSWFVQHAERKQAEQQIAAQQGPKQPLDARALAQEFVPGLAEVEQQKAALMGTTEQTVSGRDIIAAKIPPEVAAKLGRPTAETTDSTTAAQAEPVGETKPEQLSSFARQSQAEERVVQVKALTPEQVAQLEPESSPRQDNAEVLVDTYEAEPELLAEDSFEAFTETVLVPPKPRSLAIEKVELSAEQQSNLLKEKASKAEAAGALTQALEYWRQIQQLTPQSSQPYLELARLFQVQGKDNEAVQVLQQAALTAPQEPKVAMALAALALKQQDWLRALSYLQYEPDIAQYIDFYALKAAALQKTNQHSQAIQVFQQLARQQADQARWWLGMALSYDALQQNQQATLAYKQALVHGASLSASSLDYVKKRLAAIE